MNLKPELDAERIADNIIEARIISKAEKDFIKQVEEDPDGEFDYVYINEWLTRGFKKGNRRSTIYKTLFFLTLTAFAISLTLVIKFEFPSIFSYWLLLTSIIFAAQSK